MAIFTKILKFSLFIIFFITGTGTSALPRTPDTLFTLQEGKADGQIGIAHEDTDGDPEGPSLIKVDKAGNFFICDYINQCVKKYSRSGVFIAKTEGDDWQITDFCVDAGGNIYIVNNGKKVSKYGADGKKQWTVFDSAIHAEGKAAWHGMYSLYPAPDGAIAISCGHGITKASTLAILDSRGRFRKFILGDMCTDTGRVIRIIPLDAQRQAVKVVETAFDDGRQLAAYVLKLDRDSFHELKDVQQGFDWLQLDPGGCFYTLLTVKRAKFINLNRSQTIHSDIVVLAYDALNKPVRAIRFPENPFNFRSECVDAVGNIYQLAYDGHRFLVKRYKTVIPRNKPSNGMIPPLSKEDVDVPVLLPEGQCVLNLDLGKGATQIGIHVPKNEKEANADEPVTALGPQGIIVQDGKIYIGDAENNRVKVFDMQGHLVMSVLKQSNEIGQIIVDKQGSIYVNLFGEIVKLSSSGHVLWRCNASEQPSPEPFVYATFQRLFLAPDGALCVTLNDRPRTMAVISKDGAFVRFVKGEAASEDGKLYSVESVIHNQDDSQEIKIQVSDFSTGKPVSSYIVTCKGISHESWLSQIDLAGSKSLWVSPQGTLLLCVDAFRTEPLDIFPHLPLAVDSLLIDCSEGGSGGKTLRIPGDPFVTNALNIAMDEKGAVYNLEYTEKTGEVKRYDWHR